MQQDLNSRQRNYYANRQQQPALQKVNLPSYANNKQLTPTKKVLYHPQQKIDNQDKVDQIVGRISMKSSKQSKMDIQRATKIVANLMLTYNCRRKYLKMRKQHRYRVCVIKELFETEIRYVDDLLKSMTLCNYIQQWVPKQQCEEIFLNTKQIYQLNNKLLEDLKKITQYKPYDQIGKLLCEYAPFFKIYFEYYSKFKKSESTLALCLQNYPEFNKYNSSMCSSKEFKFQQIESYLVKPIQRLPKYNLLLIDLIKHTDKTHPDFKNLNQCQVLFSKVTEDNNEHLNFILMNSKLFELQRIFGSEVQVLDSNRTYQTEQNMTVLHKNKEKTVLVFLLSDLIILADTQPLQDKPYKLVFSLHLDHSSQCYDLEDLETFKNLFTLKGTTQSITFIEQTKELKVQRMQQFQQIIDNLAHLRKMREEALVKSKIKVDKVYQIQVQVIGVDERKTNLLKSHKVYIVEVQIGEVCQRIYPRFSQCLQLQDEIKKKYPKCQLNYIKQNSAFSLQSEEKEVEGRVIQVTNFITSLLAQPFMREDPKFLQALGLPENFYDLPSLITDELREKPRNRSSRGPDRMEYLSPQRQLIRKNGSVSNMGSIQEGSGIAMKKFSATQLLKEVKKPIQKQGTKEMLQILVYHFDPKHKAQLMNITFETKAIEVCEALKDKFELQEIFDFKLFMMDSKQRLKAMEDDERISDLFSGSFILDFQKKKEFYFRKYLFLDLMSEKQQLYEDHKKLELVYNQLLQEIVSAQLQFNFEEYCLLGAVYLYINGMYAQMETLGKIIPNMVLKQEKKELWITKVNQDLIKLIGQITNNSSIHDDGEDLRQQMRSQQSISTQVSQQKFDSDVNLGMMTFVQLCYKNQFCGQQIFQVNCKDLQKEFGENAFYLVVGYEGVKLFNSKKNRLLIHFEEVQLFKVFPGSIQFNTIDKNYKFETGQGFQIQSIMEEYLSLKSDFLAFDFEFSALSIDILDELTKYDSIEEQYQKTKFLCINNHVLQFGLAIFQWDPQQMFYRVQSYAFYLGTQGYMSFQSKSYKFLASYDYDFKRTFLYGIPYAQLNGIPQNNNSIQFDVHYQIDIQNELDRLKQTILAMKNNKTTFECQNREAMNLLLKQSFQEKFFKGIQRFQIQKLNEQTLLILKQGNENKLFGEPEKPKELQFQILIQEIMKSNRILIGHNASIDLCLLYHNFIDQLPNSFLEFAIKIHHLFPKILDSKLVANFFREKYNLQKKMQNNLEHLFKECYINDKGLKPFNNVYLNFDFLNIFRTQGLHDAGYDSVITGTCCICMANMMNGKIKQLQLEDYFPNQMNMYHSFGQTIQLVNPKQDNLYDNEKYIDNTLYGEFQDEQEFKQFLNDLQLQFSFEKMLIKQSFFITFDSKQELKKFTRKSNGLTVVPYQERRRFGKDDCQPKKL